MPTQFTFTHAYKSTLRNEGGYRLHTLPGDSGGQTYAGIARHRHPNWPGWIATDLPAPPILDAEALMVLVTGMLGIAGARTWEKLKGVAR